MVEAAGLEPAASWSQTKRDTKLRHASIAKVIIAKGFFNVNKENLLYNGKNFPIEKRKKRR